MRIIWNVAVSKGPIVKLVVANPRHPENNVVQAIRVETFFKTDGSMQSIFSDHALNVRASESCLDGEKNTGKHNNNEHHSQNLQQN